VFAQKHDCRHQTLGCVVEHVGLRVDPCGDALDITFIDVDLEAGLADVENHLLG
jgi:hypothetical protein